MLRLQLKGMPMAHHMAPMAFAPGPPGIDAPHGYLPMMPQQALPFTVPPGGAPPGAMRSGPPGMPQSTPRAQRCKFLWCTLQSTQDIAGSAFDACRVLMGLAGQAPIAHVLVPHDGMARGSFEAGNQPPGGEELLIMACCAGTVPVVTSAGIPPGPPTGAPAFAGGFQSGPPGMLLGGMPQGQPFIMVPAGAQPPQVGTLALCLVQTDSYMYIRLQANAEIVTIVIEKRNIHFPVQGWVPVVPSSWMGMYGGPMMPPPGHAMSPHMAAMSIGHDFFPSAAPWPTRPGDDAGTRFTAMHARQADVPALALPRAAAGPHTCMDPPSYVTDMYGRSFVASHMLGQCTRSSKEGVWRRRGSVAPDALEAHLSLAASLARPHQAHAPHGAQASRVCASLARPRQPPHT